MARRNQNTFLKRQKEIERMRKAKEKMDKRQGRLKKREDEESAEGFLPDGTPIDGTALETDSEEGVVSQPDSEDVTASEVDSEDGQEEENTPAV